MAVELSQFFTSASKLADNQALFLKNGNPADGEVLQSKSTLTGLSKLSISKQSAEKNSSIDSFTNSIQASKYQASFANVESTIAQAKADGKGLTKELVGKVKVMLELDYATSKADTLLQESKIPVGHKTSFAQYAVAFNRPLDTDADIQQTLTDYLKSQVFKPVESVAMQKFLNLDKLTGTELAVKTEKNNILKNLYQKMGMSNISKSPEATAIIAAGVKNNLSFTQIETNLKAYFEQTFELFDSFDNTPLAMLKNLPNPRATINFINNQLSTGILTEQNVQPFLQDRYYSGSDSLNDTVNLFQVKNASIADSSVRLVEIGINKEQADFLAMSLKHNPAVMDKALGFLKADGFLPATKAQAAAAQNRAITEFLAGNGDKIKELLSFVNSPKFAETSLTKALINKDGSLATIRMAQLVNAYISLAPMTTMLLDLNPNTVSETMNVALTVSKAVESCTHAFTGDYGAQDALNISIDCISIHLAMAGLKQTDLPATLQKTIEKFGGLASDLGVLANKVNNGTLADTVGSFGRNAMGSFTALQTFAGVIIGKMTDAQLKSFDLGSKDKIAEFVEKNFQADRALTQVSPELIQFARERGVVISDTIRFEAPISTTVDEQRQQSLNHINQAAAQGLHAEIFNRGSATPFIIDIATQYKAENPVLDGLNIDVNATSDFSKTIGIAIDNEVKLANAEGREININSLRDLVKTELTSYLDNCAIMSRNIHQLAVDNGVAPDAAVSLANKAIASSFLCLNHLSLLEGGEVIISESLSTLVQRISSLIEGIDLSHTEDAGISLALGMVNLISPMSNAQMQNLYNNISSPVAKDFADSVKFIYSPPMLVNVEPRLAENAIKVRSQLPLIMESLRQMSGQAIGKDEELRLNQNLYTSGELTHVTQIGDKIIHSLSSIQGTFHVPQRTEALIASGVNNVADFDFMNGLLNTFSQGDRYVSLGENLIMSMSQHFTDANKAGVTVDKALIYKQLFNERIPSSATDSNFFALLEEKAIDAAYKLVTKSKPNVTKQMIQESFFSFQISGLTFDKYLSLFRPDAKLEIGDFKKLEMSTIRDYHEGNAFGLVTDFRRMQSKSVLEFNGLTVGHAVSPFHIPDEENKSDHPEFKHIIDVVDKMCSSDLQKIRVIQAFTQASLVEARMKSTLFVGEMLDEHGGYNISANQQQDGSVVIDLKLVDESALDFTEQIVVQPDGSVAITQFNMSKNIVTQ